MLKANEARSIATALWGKINVSYRTNKIGAYYFSCEGHGGFVVSAELLDCAPWITKYQEKETAKRYIGGKKETLMHPYRTKSTRMLWHTVKTVEFFVFEEDCAYALAVLAGINLKENPIKEGDARKVFWDWYDTNNPIVANRKLVDQKRENGDSDLIISASGSWKTGIEGVCEVITADNKKHYVSGYENAWDEYGVPYLSRCKIYEMG